MSMSDVTTTDEEQEDELTAVWSGLTGFKRDTLLVLAEIANDDSRTSYGLAIKRALEDDYDTEINHGRLYPNLDDLCEADLVEKSELDKRTNEYTLTERGYAVLEVRNDRLTAAL